MDFGSMIIERISCMQIMMKMQKTEGKLANHDDERSKNTESQPRLLSHIALEPAIVPSACGCLIFDCTLAISRFARKKLAAFPAIALHLSSLSLATPLFEIAIELDPRNCRPYASIDIDIACSS